MVCCERPSDFLRVVIICSINLDVVFLVFMRKNVATIFEHELPCNVPGIRTTTIHIKG